VPGIAEQEAIFGGPLAGSMLAKLKLAPLHASGSTLTLRWPPIAQGRPVPEGLKKLSQSA
jgi:hypothetical protein